MLIHAFPVVECLDEVFGCGAHAFVEVAGEPFFDAPREEFLVFFAAELVGEAVREDEEPVSGFVLDYVIGKRFLGATLWQRLTANAFAAAFDFLELGVLGVVGGVEGARAAHVEIVERTVGASEL